MKTSNGNKPTKCFLVLQKYGLCGGIFDFSPFKELAADYFCLQPSFLDGLVFINGCCTFGLYQDWIENKFDFEIVYLKTDGNNYHELFLH